MVTLLPATWEPFGSTTTPVIMARSALCASSAPPRNKALRIRRASQPPHFAMATPPLGGPLCFHSVGSRLLPEVRGESACREIYHVCLPLSRSNYEFK